MLLLCMSTEAECNRTRVSIPRFLAICAAMHEYCTLQVPLDDFSYYVFYYASRMSAVFGHWQMTEQPVIEGLHEIYSRIQVSSIRYPLNWLSGYVLIYCFHATYIQTSVQTDVFSLFFFFIFFFKKKSFVVLYIHSVPGLDIFLD